MITGFVQERDARIRLCICGPRGSEQEIEAIIDTGYTAWLTLPPNLVAALGLTWDSMDHAILADGREVVFDVYRATIIWNGRARRIDVDEADTDPLIGMALLRGYEFKAQIRAGGKVTIRLLPGWRPGK